MPADIKHDDQQHQQQQQRESDELRDKSHEAASNVCVKRAPLEGPLPPEERNLTGEARGVAHAFASKKDMTSLEKHCAFFDRNGDGWVSPLDTYKGSRALGFNPLTSFYISAVISLALAPATSEVWYKPTISVNLRKSHRAKHGSDTGVYDENGRMVPAHFDALFDRYDTDRDGKLSVREFMHRRNAQRHVFDLFGQTASLLEFGFTYWLLSGKDWKLSREDLRGVYDGSVFYEIEKKVAAERVARAEAHRQRGWFWWLPSFGLRRKAASTAGAAIANANAPKQE